LPEPAKTISDNNRKRNIYILHRAWILSQLSISKDEALSSLCGVKIFDISSQSSLNGLHHDCAGITPRPARHELLGGRYRDSCDTYTIFPVKTTWREAAQECMATGFSCFRTEVIGAGLFRKDGLYTNW
jgi:hypothetical protein